MDLNISVVVIVVIAFIDSNIIKFEKLICWKLANSAKWQKANEWKAVDYSNQWPRSKFVSVPLNQHTPQRNDNSNDSNQNPEMNAH